MASLTTISNSIALAKGYYIELLSLELADLRVGFKSEHTKDVSCLNRLIRALTWDVADEVNDDDTQVIYKILLNFLSKYSGSILPYDPSVVIPENTVVVEGDTNYRDPKIVTVADMASDGKTYANTDLAGLTSYLIQLNGVRTLLPSTDYNYTPAGGFVLVEPIYDGQQLILIF